MVRHHRTGDHLWLVEDRRPRVAQLSQPIQEIVSARVLQVAAQLESTAQAPSQELTAPEPSEWHAARARQRTYRAHQPYQCRVFEQEKERAQHRHGSLEDTNAVISGHEEKAAITLIPNDINDVLRKELGRGWR